MGANAMKIYMASPLGFSEAGRAFYKGVLRKVKRLGHTPIDPWTLTAKAKIDRVQKIPYGAKKRDAWRKLNVEIGGNNRAGIDRADMVLAVLDGVDVDSGTAAEIGYAFGKGKPILGYRGDFRLSADNEGSTVNLQVEYFIRQSGGDIVRAVDKIGPALAKMKAAMRKRPL
jgi:nucleoside 2-deoxyribosyltransferase